MQADDIIFYGFSSLSIIIGLLFIVIYQKSTKITGLESDIIFLKEQKESLKERDENNQKTIKAYQQLLKDIINNENGDLERLNEISNNVKKIKVKNIKTEMQQEIGKFVLSEIMSLFKKLT